MKKGLESNTAKPAAGETESAADQPARDDEIKRVCFDSARGPGHKRAGAGTYQTRIIKPE